MTQAVALAADEWADFARTSGIPANFNLRDRVSYFARDFRTTLVRAFPVLNSAPEEIVLLIIAQGIERAGPESRRLIELQLGIILPPLQDDAA